MIDFPASPTNGQVFVSGAQSWTFDGTKWVASGNTVMPPLATGDNRIINGNFAINQRAYVTNTALAAAAYGHDRWKAGASGCTYTFTAAVPDTTITITANTLTQVIEAGVIEGGVYTLSWTGTAQARVYQGSPTGSYAASPIVTASLTAGTNTIVEFSTGTLGKVKLEAGSIATPYNRQSLAKSLADCQRYYFDAAGGSGQAYTFNVYTAAATTVPAGMIQLPVSMRATPTVTQRSLTGATVSALNLSPLTPQTVYAAFTLTSTGNQSGSFGMTASAEL